MPWSSRPSSRERRDASAQPGDGDGGAVLAQRAAVQADVLGDVRGVPDQHVGGVLGADAGVDLGEVGADEGGLRVEGVGQQRVGVGVVLVEGAAVHGGPVGDVGDGDLVEAAFPCEREQGILEQPPCAQHSRIHPGAFVLDRHPTHDATDK